jgi:hypothetical protein
MSTLRYNEWLAKLSSGEFDLNKATMNVMLVADTYVPNENHTRANITPYILSGVAVIVDDYFKQNGMSNILDTVKAKMVLGIQTFTDVVSKEIDRVFTGERADKLKQLIMNPENNYQFWNDLKEAGIKYFVFESTNYNCLTFCEDI